MKQKSIIAALLLLVAGMQTARGQKMTVNLTNGKTVVYRLSKVESVAFDDTPTEFTYVDLGLPSGTLWATFNIGAEEPEDYGYYFAWGETQPKDRYTLKTYRWMTEGNDSWEYINKYTIADGQTDGIWYNSGVVFVGDGKRVLETEDDAATVNWGEKWQMPSQEQAKELTQNTTVEWTTLGDVVGLKVTSNANGNSIFLPAAGYRYSTDTNSLIEAVYYWTCSNAGNGKAHEIYIRNANFNNYWSSAWNYSGNIYEGLPVRPVRKQ